MGSQSMDAASWAAGVRAVSPAVQELQRDGIELDVLNIGGGFPSVYTNHPNAPRLVDVARHVYEALEQLPYESALIVEPGRALVAESMTLVASVVARVQREGSAWLFLDAGAYNALFEALRGQGATRYPVSRLGQPTPGDLGRFVLGGPTGDSLDVIGEEVLLPGDTTVGHRLVFKNAGAYTHAMACAFNGFPIAAVHLNLDREGDGTTLDTVSRRVAIGFPRSATDWSRAPAVFTEHEHRISGHPVMQDWEADYMRVLADAAAARGGRILEVGYGLGISAGCIQAHEAVKAHVVIEAHPDVAARCAQQWRSALALGRMQLITGFWQNVCPQLVAESFDGILFDTYPLTPDEIHANHFPFFAEAFRLLRPGGAFTYYSDEARNLPEGHLARLETAGFSREHVEQVVCSVSTPTTCEYWHADTLVAPIVRKGKMP